MTPSDLVMGTEATAISTLAAWCLAADRLLVF
jgi:sulfur relay (sulfurtransferase) complex TusBCD TusD component (DsrE family)